ncbi:MAG: carbohydrate porin [Candidatus Binataceae bacterium]
MLTRRTGLVAATVWLGLICLSISFAPPAYEEESAPSAAASAAIATPVPAISANPGAVNALPGTGWLGRLIGFSPQSGISIGGIWVGNANYLFTGGVQPRRWSFNSLTIGNLNVDAEKLFGLPGSSFDASVLQFDGEDDNLKAGTTPGYDGLVGPKPMDRTELYELWWRQRLFDDKLVIRVGKMVTTSDFNNVSRPIPVTDPSLQIPSVTGVIFTPIYKNPTMFGAAPGYYNSAYGLTANLAPSSNFYLIYGLYDGAGSRTIQTGLREAPVFNGHYFTIAETGYAWLYGDKELPGIVAIGGWAKTGELYGGGTQQEGAQGVYAFGSQRLWRHHAGIDNSGISGYFQLGFNDARTMIANRYFGLGFTAFSLILERPADSFGSGLAWTWLNRRYGFRSNEAILETYYQMHLISSSFLEPVLSYIPNPGQGRNIQGAVVMTAQLVVMF